MNRPESGKIIKKQSLVQDPEYYYTDTFKLSVYDELNQNTDKYRINYQIITP